MENYTSDRTGGMQEQYLSISQNLDYITQDLLWFHKRSIEIDKKLIFPAHSKDQKLTQDLAVGQNYF